MNLAILNGAGTTEVKSEYYQLIAGDVLRLPRTCSEIRVKSGNIWITLDGKDIVLQQGESFQLTPGQDDAVVTSLHYASAFTVILR